MIIYIKKTLICINIQLSVVDILIIMQAIAKLYIYIYICTKNRRSRLSLEIRIFGKRNTNA